MTPLNILSPKMPESKFLFLFVFLLSIINQFDVVKGRYQKVQYFKSIQTKFLSTSEMRSFITKTFYFRIQVIVSPKTMIM